MSDTIVKNKIEVIRTDEYLVQIDKSVWTEEALADWSSVFWDVDNCDEMSKVVASTICQNGLNRFHEGFGYIKAFNKDGSESIQYQKNDLGEWEEVKEFVAGITITIISEEEDIETQIIEI